MPRTRKDEAPVQIDDPQIESRAVDLGDHTVVFQTYRADVDPAPLFRGLPDPTGTGTSRPSAQRRSGPGGSPSLRGPGRLE
jgi:hypothetical protein